MFDALDERFQKSLPKQPRWQKPVMLAISLFVLLVSIIGLLRR
jgi:hypothetical protein